MKKLPTVLVNTWLSIAIDKSEENREAQQVAAKNLITVFGNIHDAQKYVEQNKKDKAELSSELSSESSPEPSLEES